MRAPPDSVNVLGTIMKMKILSGLVRRAKQRAEERDRALSLYIASVEQARRPGFYTVCGVADTLDGRFDLIVLHVYLVVRGLRPAGEPGKRLADLIFKIMMDDMDMNLREMGVGDLRVGKRVKEMARAFYGRAAAYDAALDGNQAAAAALAGNAEYSEKNDLAAVLRRNVYGPEAPESEQFERLLSYVKQAEEALAARPGGALLAGEVAFLPAPGEAGDSPGRGGVEA
jgi:cytochrome b pre-mRNA-processing protein 3